MSFSTIYRTVCHFYFNYHYGESASLCMHSAFTRRVQFAIRMVISFLVGGFLAYGTPLNDRLAQEYLIPLISVMSIQETFGLTLAACFQMTLAVVPVSIFLFVVQKIGLGYHNYLAAELVLLVSSFFIAYFFSQAQTRKIPLVLCAIFIASIVNVPVIPSTFIFQLLVEVIIGMSVSLVVSFTVFPLFATLDIENRVNYCLLNLQQMQTLITQAFLCQDQMGAHVSLTRAATIEQMVRETMGPLSMKLVEAGFEPSRCLQRLFNQQRRHIIDLTVQEQENVVMAFLLHVRSIQLMVKQCQFNEYHSDLVQEIESSLLLLCSCQSSVISAITSSSLITKDEFTRRVSDLRQAAKALRLVYRQTRLHRVQNALESATAIRSEDHVAHAFFLYQFDTIARLLIQATTTEVKKNSSGKKKKKINLTQFLVPNWPRLFSAIKCMTIVGIGSIFVMEPVLAKAFENGQWIFVAICMTQGDSVGGAFTTMKMRLIGTLLGAMWAYVTYLAVHDNVYQTFGMLVPWIVVFGYLRTLSSWGYTALVSTITPILISLGRIPYGDALPAGDYALLRIEENLVGIGVAIVLTLIIFPVFAIDLLKDNIQKTLQACHDSVRSMNFTYNKLFHHENSGEVAIDVEKEEEEEEIKSFYDTQRNHFHQLITTQRTLVGHASVEPTFWWFNNNFSTIRYTLLLQQQLDMFQSLYSIDIALMRINECSINDEKQFEIIKNHTVGGLFFSSINTELTALSKQLNDSLNLWSSYFALTQTRCHQLCGHCTCSRKKLADGDLLKHEECLIGLQQTIHRLRNQHQEAIHRIMEHYLDRLTQGEPTSTFMPNANNDETDLVYIAISAMYYSTSELARSTLALGTSIHTIFELETTHRYERF